MGENLGDNGLQAAMLRGDIEELSSVYKLSDEDIQATLLARSGRIILFLCENFVCENLLYGENQNDGPPDHNGRSKVEQTLCRTYGYSPEDARAFYDEGHRWIDMAAKKPVAELHYLGLSPEDIETIKERRANIVEQFAFIANEPHPETEQDMEAKEKAGRCLAEIGFSEREFHGILLGSRTGHISGSLSGFRRQMCQRKIR